MKMVRILLSLLCCVFLSNMYGQCPPPGFPIPGNTCPEAPVLCQDINGYCTTINNNNQTQNFPGCSANVLNNDEWFAFFAGTPTITLQITPSNCTNVGGNEGLQAAIYDGCMGNALATQCDCSATPFQMSSSAFVPGQVYWVVIDGCAGDVCDYQVNVLAGSTVPTPPANPGAVSGVVNVCPGTVQPYSISPVTGATEYDWTLTPQIGIISENDNMATIDFTLPGTAQLCVTVANPCLTNPVPSCITINSTIIPPTDENVDLCLGKSVMCAGQIFFTPGFFPVTLESYLGCDSVINCFINALPPITNNLGEVELCGPDEYEICGTFYSQSGAYSKVCESWQGCDSTVIVDLALMEPEANIAEPVPEIGCGPNAQVILDGSASTMNLAANGTTSYNWTGPGIVGPTDGVTATVDVGGFYCLEVTHERNGTFCTNTYCVDVPEDKSTPDQPLLDGPKEICDGVSGTYTVTPVGGVTVTGFSWFMPNGEPFTVDSPTSITVDWANSVGGDLCVTANNDCGESSLTCITVMTLMTPEDPILDGEIDVCDGQELTYSILNPTDGATCSWTVPAGASFTDNGDNILVDFSGASSGDICVSCMNNCGMTQNVCLPVIVTKIPDVPEISAGEPEVCEGNMVTYCVLSDPNAIDYSWTTPAGNFPNVGNCLDIDWTGISGGLVCVTANNDCGSSPEACIQVTVNENPTATLNGGGNFCEGSGDTIQLTIDLTGLAPWTLVWSDGTNSVTDTGITESPFIISTTESGNFSLTSISDASICAGQTSGEAEVIENPLPTVQLSGSGSICKGSGETVDLTIHLTGDSPWMVNWTSDGDPQAPININSSPYTLEIGQSQGGDIELTDVTDANGCSNTGDGTVINIPVNDAPVISNIMTECNGANTGFTVSFEISGGDPSTYLVTSNVLGFTGTLSSDPPYIFTSDEILNGDGYSWVINDGNDCDPITLEDDQVQCDCETQVGTMSQNPIETCGGNFVTATYLGVGEVLDSDDIIEYILHEGSGVTIVNQLDRNTLPTFNFQFGMQHGQTYYISAVAGNQLVPGIVDPNDDCISVAQGTPIVFYEEPTAFMFGDMDICEGETAGLNIEFTGDGPWDLLYDLNGELKEINGINANPFTLNVTPTSNTTVTLINVNNENCDGDVDGEISIEVNSGVTVTNVSNECNATSTVYNVMFEISGGDPNSYDVSGVFGSISATPPYIFTSFDIPTGQGYDITVDDANGCSPQNLVQNAVVCDCVTKIGTMDLNPIEECTNGPITAVYDTTGQATDANDIFMFVLHTGNLNLGTILQTNPAEPSFSFDPATMNYGTTYYISAIAGNDDGNGNVDSAEPCFAFVQGTPVTFFEVPTAILSGDADICEGESANLTVNLSGDSPWSLIVNGIAIPGIVSKPFIYKVTPSQSETYILEGLSDENCTGTFSGVATVNVHSAPSVSNVMVECNLTNTHYTVTFEIEGGDESCYSVSGNGGTLTGNMFESNPIPTGQGYLFNVNDCNDCGPVAVQEPIIVCDCETMAGEMEAENQTVCGIGPVTATYLGGEILDADDTYCFILHDGNSDTPLAKKSEPKFQFQPATMNYGQTYYICAVAGNDNGNGCVAANDPCRSVSTTCAEVIFNEKPTAAMTGDAIICAGETVDLTVSFSGGTAPYTFTYEDAFTTEIETVTANQNPFILSVMPTGSTVYNLLDLQDSNCAGDATGSFPVTVNAAPTVSAIGTICNDQSTAYTVSFTINSGNPNITVNPPGSGTLTANAPFIFTSNEIDAFTGYAFEIDNVNGCGPVFISGDAPICECITEAGSMNLGVSAACVTEAITTFHGGDEVLDPNDVLGFMLHPQDGGNYADALATNTIPTFAFDPATMTPGVTYYICPTAGNNLGNGSPDPDEECFVIGSCAPVFWYPTPTATISGETSICEGEATGVTFQLTGVSPFSIDYTVDGNPENMIVFGTDTTIMISPTTNTEYVLTGISDMISGCSDAATGSILISVSQNVSSGVETDPLELCGNDDVIIDLFDRITGEDPGGIWSNQLGQIISNIFDTSLYPPDEYWLTYTVSGQDPCPDASTTIQIKIYENPTADAGTDQSLDCTNTVGELGGQNTSQGDFSYQWSGGVVANPKEITTTTSEAGIFTLTVTDNQTGCSDTDQIEIVIDQTAPAPTITFSDLSCFEANDGFISLDPITGGVPPYECSINGGAFGSNTTFNNLSAGMHTIVCRDSKGCEIEIPVEITQPDKLNVEITGDFENDDEAVNLGDSVLISLMVNFPFSSLDAMIWTPAELIPCDSCPNFYITPTQSTQLSITVEQGICSATDELNIFVRKNRPVYVPNAFSPNNDGTNDKLIVFGGNSVAQVKNFLILNRWGETIWQYQNFQPGDPASGWDGFHRGELMDAGVFVWFAEVEFIDGETEIFEGDVVLVR